jgi:hypothetical protein
MTIDTVNWDGRSREVRVDRDGREVALLIVNTVGSVETELIFDGPGDVCELIADLATALTEAEAEESVPVQYPPTAADA